MLNPTNQIKRTLIMVFTPLFVMGGGLSLQAQTSQELQPKTEDTPSLSEQYQKIIELNKAKNLARQAAEKANGGLTEYRAEPAMHGPGQSTNYEQIEQGVWKFRFKGRRPSEEEYTIESVVVVDMNNNTVDVEYNGPVR
ncbi:MAG: hypothetical protein BRC33_12335 [Cyanobacteria bacterium SW_9_44_58]|nr:MAG: hypothetical protein BRC33_12335 [Cyanobacteria bacterium SW_9_44_58]